MSLSGLFSSFPCLSSCRGLAGYFIVAPHKEDPSRTEMTWVYCSDIKGWVPAWVIDAATTSSTSSTAYTITSTRRPNVIIQSYCFVA